MVSRFNNKQSRNRSILDQLSPDVDIVLDDVLGMVNSELTPPLRLTLSESNPTAIHIGNINVVSGTGRNRTIQPFGSPLAIPTFESGDITFGLPGQSITIDTLIPSPATSLPSMGISNYINVLICLSNIGQIILSFSEQNVDPLLVLLPSTPVNCLAIGCVKLLFNGTSIQDIVSSNITQFGSGSSNPTDKFTILSENTDFGIIASTPKVLVNSILANRTATIINTEPIYAGDIFVIKNTTGYNLVIKSASGETITTINNCMVELYAMVDSPSSAANWDFLTKVEYISGIKSLDNTGTVFYTNSGNSVGMYDDNGDWIFQSAMTFKLIIKFDSDSGKTTITRPDNLTDLTLILPAAAATVNDQALVSTTGGQLSWLAFEPPISKNTAFNKNYSTTATDIKMNGVQSAGDSTDTIARSTHIHPSDTSKANTAQTFYLGGTQIAINRPIGTGLLTLTGITLTSPTLTSPSIGVASGTSFNSITGLSITNPSMDGSVSYGSGTTVARADHIHPTDTSREATLGNPGTNGYVLSSLTDGTRSWIAMPSSLPTLISGRYLTNNGALASWADTISVTSVTSPTIYGSTIATGTLTLSSTSDATKGMVIVDGYCKISSPTIPTVATGTGTLNCNSQHIFYKTGGNAAITLSNFSEGQTITVVITAAGGTISWLSTGCTFKWADGTIPTPTPTTADTYDVFSFIRIGTVIYGSYILNLKS